MSSSRILRSSPLTQIVPSLAAICFCIAATVAHGLGEDHRPSIFGYFMLAITALMVANLLVSLTKPTVLTLSDDGFIWQSWRYRASFRWADIASFGIGRSAVPLAKPKIAFNFRPGHIPDQHVATSVNRSVNGYDRSMNNVWNINSDDLVVILNEYVERANGSLQ